LLRDMTNTPYQKSQGPLYLLVHSDHYLDVHGPNSGAEMASLNQARALAKAGRRVCLAARLKEPVAIDRGVEFFDLGAEYRVESALDWADSQGRYVLVAAGKSFALMLSRRHTQCIRRLLVTHDRSAGDSGLKPDVLEHMCDHVLCVSEAQREKLALEGIPPKLLSVIHNGVDFEIFRPVQPELHNPRRLVFSGALVPDKGLHLLLGSFVTLLPAFPDLEIDIFGSASLWSRDDYLDLPGIMAAVPGVHFHGKATQSRIAQAMGRAGICVVPSIWFDPYPLTSLEAQACGCPVAAFRVGGLPEGIAHNSTGVIIDTVSEEALTQTLRELISDPQRLHVMSEAALAWSHRNFDWQDVAKKIIRAAEPSLSFPSLGAASAAFQLGTPGTLANDQ